MGERLPAGRWMRGWLSALLSGIFSGISSADSGPVCSATSKDSHSVLTTYTKVPLYNMRVTKINKQRPLPSRGSGYARLHGYVPLCLSPFLFLFPSFILSTGNSPQQEVE